MVMYLGTVVEYCDVKQLFPALHPYTKALLSAIPVPDGCTDGTNHFKKGNQFPNRAKRMPVCRTVHLCH